MRDFSAVDNAYAKLGDDILRLKDADAAVNRADAERAQKEAALAAARAALEAAENAYQLTDADVEASIGNVVTALRGVGVDLPELPPFALPAA